ncbi:hypothetical protein V5O48_018987 [Marasmius crinis-equi]|uniref:Uncharacterized protein n=1 Tax=Marasmius crinis-equi TaxID=585013 RepID=A0ABR3EJS0_9AGAR
MEDEEPKSTKRKRGKSKGGVKGKGKGAVKPKLKEKKKGSSSKKAAAHDQETAESDFSLEFEDDSGGEALVAGVGMDDEEAAVEGVGRGDGKQGELEDEGVEGGEGADDEEDELNEDRPRGPPMSAYEMAREANIERIRNIWEDLGGPQAFSQLKHSLTQPPRPLPKPKRKTKDPIDIAPSSIVTRSQRNSHRGSPLNKAASSSSMPSPDQALSTENAVPDKPLSPLPPDENDPILPPSPDQPLRPESTVSDEPLPQHLSANDAPSPSPPPENPPSPTVQEIEPRDPSEPSQPMEGVVMAPVAQSPSEHQPNHRPGPSQTIPPPPAVHLSPPSPSHASSPHVVLPNPASSCLLFLEVFRGVNVDFDPALDMIHPSAYDRKKKELIRKLGEWLFKMPAGCAYET